MKDLKHYLFLMAILSIGFGLFWIFNFNRQIQMWITVGLGVAYVLWGVMHHTIKKELHFRIVWEYLLVAIFACTIIVFLLART